MLDPIIDAGHENELTVSFSLDLIILTALKAHVVGTSDISRDMFYVVLKRVQLIKFP